MEPIGRANKKMRRGKKLTTITAAPQTGEKHLVDFTKAELQMTKYVNELLSHGIRTYSFGFLLQGTKMTLWYLDRMGMVSSKAFDIFKDSQLFLLFVAALHFSDRHKLGINPLVKYPRGVAQTHEGAVLELPRATRSDGKVLTSILKFDLRISVDTPLVVAYGALGRGTTVVPVRATGHTKRAVGDDNLVVKLSWPSIHRKSEADIIRIVRKKLGDHQEGRAYVRNIVELRCSLERTSAEMNLPRAFMALPEPYESRLFRALVLKEYLPLEQVESLDHFTTVYIHVFDGMLPTYHLCVI